MFLRGMWQPMQLPPAPVGSWCAWAANAAGAGGARHLARAAAQQEVAPFAGGDRAAARIIAAARPALPGERIAREQHLMAARADAVHQLGAGHLSARRRLHVE